MNFTKSVCLNADVCYAINKCCQIPGYAYRLQYVSDNTNEIQTIYSRKITFNRDFYGEINVKFKLQDNPVNETCWIDFTLFSLDNKQLANSEPTNELIGTYNLKFQENIFELFLDEELDSEESVTAVYSE